MAQSALRILQTLVCKASYKGIMYKVIQSKTLKLYVIHGISSRSEVLVYYSGTLIERISLTAWLMRHQSFYVHQ